MTRFHKIIGTILFPVLTTTPLSGCAAFQKNPVAVTTVVAAAPLVLPFAVPLVLLKIAGEEARPRPLRLPPNELPMYGSQPKNQAMQDADQRFIEEALKFDPTREHASDRAVRLGWRYFMERRDIATAMKRFNQAWLLDPDNGDAFHGFAILVMERDRDITRADALFRQGIAKPRQSPGIWLDYGRFLVMARKPAEAVAPLRRALTFPDMGPDARALLTLALEQSGDHAAACAEKDKVQDGAQLVIRNAARAVRCVS